MKQRFDPINYVKMQSWELMSVSVQTAPVKWYFPKAAKIISCILYLARYGGASTAAYANLGAKSE